MCLNQNYFVFPKVSFYHLQGNHLQKGTDAKYRSANIRRIIANVF